MNNSAKKLKDEFGWEEGTAMAHVNSRGHCEYCGDDLLSSRKSYFAMQIDHLLPKHVYDDHRFNFANYVTSCPACNLAKGRFDPLQSGEEAGSMLMEARSVLIDRVRNHLTAKFAGQQREFEAVKRIIRSA